MWLLWESGAMAVLLPELAAFLDDAESTGEAGRRFWRRLGVVDQMIAARGKALDDVTLFAALLAEPMQEAITGTRDKNLALAELLQPLVERIAMPRRISDGMRRTLTLVTRLAAGKVVRSDIAPAFADAIEIERAVLR